MKQLIMSYAKRVDALQFVLAAQYNNLGIADAAYTHPSVDVEKGGVAV